MWSEGVHLQSRKREKEKEEERGSERKREEERGKASATCVPFLSVLVRSLPSFPFSHVLMSSILLYFISYLQLTLSFHFRFFFSPSSVLFHSPLSHSFFSSSVIIHRALRDERGRCWVVRLHVIIAADQSQRMTEIPLTLQTNHRGWQKYPWRCRPITEDDRNTLDAVRVEEEVTCFVAWLAGLGAVLKRQRLRWEQTGRASQQSGGQQRVMNERRESMTHPAHHSQVAFNKHCAKDKKANMDRIRRSTSKERINKKQGNERRETTESERENQAERQTDTLEEEEWQRILREERRNMDRQQKHASFLMIVTHCIFILTAGNQIEMKELDQSVVLKKREACEKGRKQWTEWETTERTKESKAGNKQNTDRRMKQRETFSEFWFHSGVLAYSGSKKKFNKLRESELSQWGRGRSIGSLSWISSWCRWGMQVAAIHNAENKQTSPAARYGLRARPDPGMGDDCTVCWVSHTCSTSGLSFWHHRSFCSAFSSVGLWFCCFPIQCFSWSSRSLVLSFSLPLFLSRAHISWWRQPGIIGGREPSWSGRGSPWPSNCQKHAVTGEQRRRRKKEHQDERVWWWWKRKKRK